MARVTWSGVVGANVWRHVRRVMRHGMIRKARVHVSSGAGRPITGRRGKVSRPCRRNMRRVWIKIHVHKIQFSIMMISGHKQVLLIFVGGRVGGWRLHGLRQTGKVKLVGVALAVHLGHDVLVVVVAKGTWEFVIVHVGFALAFSPSSSHLVRVDQLELAVRALPRDVLDVRRVWQ